MPEKKKVKDFKSIQEITDKITALSATIAQKKKSKEPFSKERNRRAYLYKKRKQLQPTTETKVNARLDEKKVKELPKKYLESKLPNKLIERSKKTKKKKALIEKEKDRIVSEKLKADLKNVEKKKSLTSKEKWRQRDIKGLKRLEDNLKKVEEKIKVKGTASYEAEREAPDLRLKIQQKKEKLGMELDPEYVKFKKEQVSKDHQKEMRDLAKKHEKIREEKKEMKTLSDQSLKGEIPSIGDPKGDFDRLKKVYEHTISKKMKEGLGSHREAQKTLYDLDKYSNSIFRRMKRLGKKGIEVKGFIDRVHHNQKEFKKKYNETSMETGVFKGVDTSNIRMKLKPDLKAPTISGVKVSKKPEKLRIKSKKEFTQKKLNVKKRPEKETQSLRKQLKASLGESKKAEEVRKRENERKERIQAKEKARDEKEKQKVEPKIKKPKITPAPEPKPDETDELIRQLAEKLQITPDELKAKITPQKEEPVKEQMKEEIKAEVKAEVKAEKEKEELKEEIKKEVIEEIKPKEEEKPEPEPEKKEEKVEERPKEELQKEGIETGYESVSTEDLDEKIKQLKAEREQTSNQGLKQKVNELRKQRGQEPAELKKTGKIWVKESTRKGRTVKAHYRVRPQRT